MSEPAKKLEARPEPERPWHKGIPIRTCQLDSGPLWKGLRDGQGVDSNVYHMNRHRKVKAWFHAGLCYFEHQEIGTVVMSLSKMRHVELDI